MIVLYLLILFAARYVSGQNYWIDAASRFVAQTANQIISKVWQTKKSENDKILSTEIYNKAASIFSPTEVHSFNETNVYKYNVLKISFRREVKKSDLPKLIQLLVTQYGLTGDIKAFLDQCELSDIQADRFMKLDDEPEQEGKVAKLYLAACRIRDDNTVGIIVEMRHLKFQLADLPQTVRFVHNVELESYLEQEIAKAIVWEYGRLTDQQKFPQQPVLSTTGKVNDEKVPEEEKEL